nr:hypothetical protein [Micromonospora sp. DSM 115978]
MGEFLDVALGFPTVLFTFLLIVVVGYWLLVLIGAVDLDADSGAAIETLGPDGDAGASAGLTGVLAGLGLGGMPASVALSLLIAAAWFVSLAGGVLLAALDAEPWVWVLLAIAVLAVAVVLAWLIAWLLMLPLRHFFPLGPQSSRHDFVGRTCVIRTRTVTTAFGQAEVTSSDGSSAIIQVRKAGDDPLGAGNTAVIYDYDVKGEFFWVAPVDSALRSKP